jgi:hypothetical protein
VEEIRVSGWGELQEQLYATSWQPELRRSRSDFAYRGRNDAAEDLGTSLLRLGGTPAAVEVHLLRNFRKYAQREAVPFDSVWNWLALAQHHGLPTRGSSTGRIRRMSRSISRPARSSCSTGTASFG